MLGLGLTSVGSNSSHLRDLKQARAECVALLAADQSDLEWALLLRAALRRPQLRRPQYHV